MRRTPVRWSPEAAGNLREVCGRIAADSPAAALSFARRVLKAVGRLEGFPLSGRRVPELSDQSPPPREVIVGVYRVFYRLRAGVVEVVTMFHGRRRAPPS